MRILAIETSCDETSIALVDAKGGVRAPKFTVFKNLVSSQVLVHSPFGGVVPNLAKREHLKNLPVLYSRIFSKERLGVKKKFDLIAVTAGPGLAPALWAGINFAKELSKTVKKPLVGVNHMEGHLYSFLLKEKTASKQNVNGLIKFPAVALVVSGGHTMILLMKSLTKWKKLGETRDDAAGEAFDKVARMLGLSYPGGPQISKIARKGNRNAVVFPQPMRNQKNYDFSFSGIKTSVLYYLRDNPNVSKADIAASFEEAVTEVLTFKAFKAAKEFRVKTLLLSGGVAANILLRKKLSSSAKKLGIAFKAPGSEFNTDNAAMIAVAAYIKQIGSKKIRLVAQPNLSL